MNDPEEFPKMTKRTNQWQKLLPKSPLTALMRMPEYGSVTEIQTMNTSPDQVILVSEISVPDVPYGDHFDVRSWLVVSSISSEVTQIDAYVDTQWKKSTWLKSKIESATEEEWVASLADIRQVLSSILFEHSLAIPKVSSAKGSLSDREKRRWEILGEIKRIAGYATIPALILIVTGLLCLMVSSWITMMTKISRLEALIVKYVDDGGNVLLP